MVKTATGVKISRQCPLFSISFQSQIEISASYLVCGKKVRFPTLANCQYSLPTKLQMALGVHIENGEMAIIQPPIVRFY